MDAITIRAEEEKDRREVEELIREAFWQEDRILAIGVGATEHYMVHRMRGNEGIPELTFVAERDGKIVGYVICTKGSYILKADGTKLDVLNFGPLGVLPGYQNQGVGSALMNHSVKRAESWGTARFFHRHPSYYPRFGFKEAASFTSPRRPARTSRVYGMSCGRVI
jgi:predicted N-acetyltransferase YhbS